MKFRDAEQRARVCRALLTTVLDRDAVDRLWTHLGPTEMAIAVAESGFSAVLGIREQRVVALRLAWDVWNDGGNFRVADAIAHWPERAWTVLEQFCGALADDAAVAEDPGADLGADTSLDEWVHAVEGEHGWVSA